MLPQWHVKDSGHSAQSGFGGLHLNKHTHNPVKLERAHYATVQVQCGNLSGNEFTRNLSGNNWPQLSQLTEPLWIRALKDSP